MVGGFIAYLIGATGFGFAAKAQGVPVGSRTALLLLLLLAVIPVASVAGLIGILITATVRKAHA